MRKGLLHGRYDRFADVLYLTVGSNDYVRFDEDDDGLIWRYGVGAIQPVGITVREFREYWHPNVADLIRKIALTLHEAEPEVRSVILNLTENSA
jgi:hypothetical protein